VGEEGEGKGVAAPQEYGALAANTTVKYDAQESSRRRQLEDGRVWVANQKERREEKEGAQKAIAKTKQRHVLTPVTKLCKHNNRELRTDSRCIIILNASGICVKEHPSSLKFSSINIHYYNIHYRTDRNLEHIEQTKDHNIKITFPYSMRANKYEHFPISGEGDDEKNNTAVKKTRKPRTECIQYSTGRESPGTAKRTATDDTKSMHVCSMMSSVSCKKKNCIELF
jgi:hypothetical protein